MVINNETKEMLGQFAERIQKLDENIKDIQTSKKEVLAEAKSAGFEAKHINAAIREIRKLKKDASSRDLQDIYMEIIKAAGVVEPV